jgi:hypothetical protein
MHPIHPMNSIFPLTPLTQSQPQSSLSLPHIALHILSSMIFPMPLQSYPISSPLPTLSFKPTQARRRHRSTRRRRRARTTRKASPRGSSGKRRRELEVRRQAAWRREWETAGRGRRERESAWEGGRDACCAVGAGREGWEGGTSACCGCCESDVVSWEVRSFGGEMNWGRRDLRGIRPPPGIGNGGGGTPGEESVR